MDGKEVTNQSKGEQKTEMIKLEIRHFGRKPFWKWIYFYTQLQMMS
jgi:hypothetical protein